MPKIIHAISGPRNISTALMYSFAQRPGCAVIDEPMYGVYLKKWDPDHPGKEATLSQWPTSIAGVRARVVFIGARRDFSENMAVICEALGIPPREEMLSWKAGQKPYDGPWWPHWYTKVHKSVGFGPAKAMPKMLRADHEAVVQATLPAYEALHEQRLRFV